MTESHVEDVPTEAPVGVRVEQADERTRPSRSSIPRQGPDGAPGTRGARPAMMEMRQRLRQVLAAQTFPADRWELIVTAEVYGADLITRSELQALAPVRFRCMTDVLLAVESTRRACPWLQQ